MEKTFNINELNMDMTTYNKVKGKLNPDEKKNVTITSDEPKTQSSQSSFSSMSNMLESEVIEPKDVNTIKYLSNVKDKQNGEISKPFTIGEKRYQMVRGENGKKEVVIGVYCFDDLNENGENIIHPIDYFEGKIAKPMKEISMVGQNNQVNDGFDYASAETEYHDKANLIDYLNLKDIEPIYKHFFVDLKSGEVTAKFKTTKEMIKSGVKLGPNEDYMDIKTLKRFRFGDYFKKDITENEEEEESGTDVTKLKADVRKLVTLIKNKFGMYLAKLDKPIEQAEFLNTMAAEVGVPLTKLSSIINNYKEVSKNQTINESKIFLKKELEKTNKKLIKVTTVKNLFDE
jgi:hypothetical protein